MVSLERTNAPETDDVAQGAPTLPDAKGRFRSLVVPVVLVDSAFATLALANFALAGFLSVQVVRLLRTFAHVGIDDSAWMATQRTISRLPSDALGTFPYLALPLVFLFLYVANKNLDALRATVAPPRAHGVGGALLLRPLFMASAAWLGSDPKRLVTRTTGADEPAALWWLSLFVYGTTLLIERYVPPLEAGAPAWQWSLTLGVLATLSLLRAAACVGTIYFVHALTARQRARRALLAGIG